MCTSATIARVRIPLGVLALAIVLSTISATAQQRTEHVALGPRIGVVIDAAERSRYDLFEEIAAFAEAMCYLDQDGRVHARVALTDGNSMVVRFTREQLRAIASHIASVDSADGHPDPMPGSWPRVSLPGDDDFAKGADTRAAAQFELTMGSQWIANSTFGIPVFGSWAGFTSGNWGGRITLLSRYTDGHSSNSHERHTRHDYHDEQWLDGYQITGFWALRNNTTLFGIEVGGGRVHGQINGKKTSIECSSNYVIRPVDLLLLVGLFGPRYTEETCHHHYEHISVDTFYGILDVRGQVNILPSVALDASAGLRVSELGAGASGSIGASIIIGW